VNLISGIWCHLNAGCTVKLQQGSGLSAQPSTQRHYPIYEGKMPEFYRTFRPYFTASQIYHTSHNISHITQIYHTSHKYTAHHTNISHIAQIYYTPHNTSHITQIYYTPHIINNNLIILRIT
jgi:hypothetical protein